MHLSTISSYAGSYDVLGCVKGNYVSYLGQGGVTIGEIAQKAEDQVVEAADKLGAWGVIGLTYSIASYEQLGTGWVAVLVAGTAVTKPTPVDGGPLGATT
jgi:uncharacterized protein YbjQ (UPF0145 family)